MRRVLTIDTADASNVGKSFQTIMQFMEQHRPLEMTLTGERVKWVRGRSKKHNSRVGRVVQETLVIRIPGPHLFPNRRMKKTR